MSLHAAFSVFEGNLSILLISCDDALETRPSALPEQPSYCAKLSTNKHLGKAARHGDPINMEQAPLINALIATEHLPDADLLINALRKAGYRVSAEAVRDESHLREQLQRKRWDILLLLPEEYGIALSRLFDMSSELAQDIACIVLGAPYDQEGKPLVLPNHCVLCPQHDLHEAKDLQQWLRCVRHELDALALRRELRQSSAAYKELQTRYQLLLHNTSDAVAYLHEGLHLYANAAYVTLFGFNNEAALKQHGFLDLVDEQNLAAMRNFLRETATQHSGHCSFLGITAPHSLSRLSLQAFSARYEDEPCIQVIIRPSVGNIDQQQARDHQHSLDLVTDLLNRSAILASIDHAISRSIYEHSSSAVLLLSLDAFTDFAVTAGKSVANLLLADVAQRLRLLIPPDALAGHYGEGEFIILLNADNVYEHGQLLLQLSSNVQQHSSPLACGLGMAIVNELSASAAVIIERARHHLAVCGKRSSHELMPGNAQEMLHTLRNALAQDSFVLAFQPVVNFKEDGLERYEVRVRMQGQDKPIYPAQFLELANQHGLGESVDRWVCANALQVLREHNNPALILMLNVTHDAILSQDFLPWLRQQMQQNRVKAEQICLQISELDVVSSLEQVKAFCARLQALGLGLSIKHFGGTLRPLSYLPLEELRFVKLDKTWLENIDTDHIQGDTLRNLVSSLHAYGLLVIAPMIDRIDLLPALWQAHINLVQGNCLQEPSPSMNFPFVQDEEITLDAIY